MNSALRIFQRFVIDDLSPEYTASKVSGVVTELKKLGYTILTSSCTHRGSPESMIVAGSVESSLKMDFERITHASGMYYKSDVFYTEE